MFNMMLRDYEYQYKRTVEPTAEPVSVKELQDHMLGYNSDDNPLLAILIKECRALLEDSTGLAMIEQTWELVLPGFPEVIKLGKAPIRSITSITYYDGAGDDQTVTEANYRYSDHGLVPRITEAYGKSWPSVEAGRVDAVKVTFVAGVYTTTGSPGDEVDTATDPQTHFAAKYRLAQRAIKVIATHFYENRGMVAPVELNDIPMSYQSLVNACRVAF